MMRIFAEHSNARSIPTSLHGVSSYFVGGKRIVAGFALVDEKMRNFVYFGAPIRLILIQLIDWPWSANNAKTAR